VRGVLAAYIWALHDALEKYGIEIPVPQREVRVRDWTALQDQEARNQNDGPDD
jgi:small-conductance mechanosensitive channel